MNRKRTLLGLGLLLATGAIVYWQLFTVHCAEGWHYRVLRAGLERVDNLAFDPSGNLYATLEKRSAALVVLVTGHRTEVVIDGSKTGLRMADGLYCDGQARYLTEELKRSGRLLRYHEGRLAVIAQGLWAPQGITFDSEGRVLVAQQRRGRILLFSRNARKCSSED